MDTRLKILTGTEAARLRGRCVVITGYFDPLHAEHVRVLREFARPGLAMVAVVLDPPAPLLHARARAELAAALSIIDFVIPAGGDPEALLELLEPIEILRGEDQDQSRTARLIEHVQQRYRPE